MATEADVRAIAMALPGVVETTGEQLTFAVRVKSKSGVKDKAIAWSWRERVDPKKKKVVNRGVIVVPVDGLDAKEALLAIDPTKIFTEPHYNGYAMVLVRLAAVNVAELAQLLTDAWRYVSPKPTAEAATVPKAKATPKAKTKPKAKAEPKAKARAKPKPKPRPKPKARSK
jgi:hypothetical protein